MIRYSLTLLLFITLTINNSSTAFSLTESWDKAKGWVSNKKIVCIAAGACSLFGLYSYFTRNSLYGYEKRVKEDIQVTQNGAKSGLEALQGCGEVALYLHGWHEYKEVKRARIWSENMREMPLVTFTLTESDNPLLSRDNGKRKLHLLNLVPSIAKTNFGQLPDVLRALLVFKELKKQGVHTTNVLAPCRSAACFFNLIHVLKNYETYKDILQGYDITNSFCCECLEMIERGKHLISAPLLDISVPLRIPGLRWLLPLVTRYNVFGLDAKTSIEDIQGMHFNALGHFQRNDAVIKDVNNQWLLDILRNYSMGSIEEVYDESTHRGKTPELNQRLRFFYA